MTLAEFNKCVDAYSDGVYRFILKNIRDEDTAKDIVQDSFEKMWRKFREINFEKARSYLFTTAYHTLVDHIRKSKKSVSVDRMPDRESAPDTSYTGLKEILDDALQKLPDIQRTVILLRDYEGYSYEEIGNITTLTESQVKVYIFRARVFLKNYIGKPEMVV